MRFADVRLQALENWRLKVEFVAVGSEWVGLQGL